MPKTPILGSRMFILMDFSLILQIRSIFEVFGCKLAYPWKHPSDFWKILILAKIGVTLTCRHYGILQKSKILKKTTYFADLGRFFCKLRPLGLDWIYIKTRDSLENQHFMFCVPSFLTLFTTSFLLQTYIFYKKTRGATTTYLGLGARLFLITFYLWFFTISQ